MPMNLHAAIADSINTSSNGAKLYQAVYVAEGTSENLHDIEILDETIADVPAIGEHTFTAGDVLVCIKGGSVPLAILGKFYSNPTAADPTTDEILSALVATGKVPGQRIATTVVTSDSSSFTAESQLMSVTASLVTGRTYKITADLGIATSITAAAQSVAIRIRENNTSGNELQIRQILSTLNTTLGLSAHVEAEFTASSTGNKVFVVTGTENFGDASHFLEASSSNPAYLYVDYIRG